jgi:hypothetical protein
MKHHVITRILVGITVATGVFAGVYGLADSLGVSSDTLGSGNTVVVPGTGTTMDLSFAGVKASDVTGVHVIIAG